MVLASITLGNIGLSEDYICAIALYMIVRRGECTTHGYKFQFG